MTTEKTERTGLPEYAEWAAMSRVERSALLCKIQMENALEQVEWEIKKAKLENMVRTREQIVNLICEQNRQMIVAALMA